MDYSNSDSVGANLGDQSDHSYNYLPTAGPGPADTSYDYSYHQGDYAYHQGGVAYAGPVPELNIRELTVPGHNGLEHDHFGDANGPCRHPYGRQGCPSHSTHASHTNMFNDTHSDYDTTCGAGELAGTETDDPKMLSRGKEKRRDVSLPPTMERYVQDPQPHEMLASGNLARNEHQSKKDHKRKAHLTIVNKDRKF